MNAEFIPTADGQEAEGSSGLFGITPGPMLYGVLALVAGVGLGIYLGMYHLKPALDKQAQLKTDIQDREANIQNSTQALQKIEEAQAELQRARSLHAQVLGLFANENSLETLLLDINQLIPASGNQNQTNRDFRIVKFEPKPDQSGVVQDGLLGPAVNGQLKRRVYDVELEATFPQTQRFLQSLEQLQNLVVVRNLKTTLNAETQRIIVDASGKVANKPAPTLVTSFTLEALAPVSLEEIAAKAAAEAAAAAAAQQQQQPAQ